MQRQRSKTQKGSKIITNVAKVAVSADRFRDLVFFLFSFFRGGSNWGLRQGVVSLVPTTHPPAHAYADVLHVLQQECAPWETGWGWCEGDGMSTRVHRCSVDCGDVWQWQR
jgi:hypothetical protein